MAEIVYQTENKYEDQEFPFIPPCMRCQPIIDSLNVQFHQSESEMPVKLFEETEWKFGTCDITIRGEIPITNKRLHIFFTIDTSGSMNDKCLDERRKIDHILYTLENILRIFHNKTECNISISIQTFNSKIQTIFDKNTLIKDLPLEELISLIKKIKASDSTNIELALQSAKEKISNYKQINPEHEIIHIFLTDGEITVGNDNIEILKTLVPQDCKNVFIGYGLVHDSKLLTNLSDNSKDEYRFIDVLEKAGLVYGEIIHSILYKAIANVSIVAENCEIYDYKKNMWVTELKIGDLLSEQKKTYHLRSSMLDAPRIILYGKTIIKTRQHQIMTNDIEEQLSCCSIFETDLTKYIFRQKTQELLYKAKVATEKTRISDPLNLHFGLSDEKKEVKNELKTFLKFMVQYMKDHNLETDPIMKTLCDDIYISYITIGTELDNMYTNARQVSQGYQYSYAVSGTQTQEVQQSLENIDEDDMTLQIPTLRRQRYHHYVDMDDEDINYSLTQTYLSPYSTHGILQTMREVSGDYTLDLCSQKTEYIN